MTGIEGALLSTIILMWLIILYLLRRVTDRPDNQQAIADMLEIEKLRRDLEHLRRQSNDTENAVEIYISIIEQLIEGVRLLDQQLREAELPPVWTLAEVQGLEFIYTLSSDMNTTLLAALMREAFNMEDLHQIAFELDIEHDSLPRTRRGAIREIIGIMERRNDLMKLLKKCRIKSPFRVWNVGPTPFQVKPS